MRKRELRIIRLFLEGSIEIQYDPLPIDFKKLKKEKFSLKEIEKGKSKFPKFVFFKTLFGVYYEGEKLGEVREVTVKFVSKGTLQKTKKLYKKLINLNPITKWEKENCRTKLIC